MALFSAIRFENCKGGCQIFVDFLVRVDWAMWYDDQLQGLLLTCHCSEISRQSIQHSSWRQVLSECISASLGVHCFNCCTSLPPVHSNPGGLDAIGNWTGYPDLFRTMLLGMLLAHRPPPLNQSPPSPLLPGGVRPSPLYAS